MRDQQEDMKILVLFTRRKKKAAAAEATDAAQVVPKRMNRRNPFGGKNGEH